jgi:hypothetical protein
MINRINQLIGYANKKNLLQNKSLLVEKPEKLLIKEKGGPLKYIITNNIICIKNNIKIYKWKTNQTKKSIFMIIFLKI